MSVFASKTSDVIIDINRYFILPSANPSALQYYPLGPCRIADTRNSTGAFGGPSLVGQSPRTFPVLSSACNIPVNAQAYSLNFTAYPPGPLGYVTAWPTGQTQPYVASLNASTGIATSNAALIPAGTGGSIDVFASNTTDLVIDIDGYFAPAGPNGLYLYGLLPCRVFDSRDPPGNKITGSFKVPVANSSSSCVIRSTARAYIFNVTAVPEGADIEDLKIGAGDAAQPGTTTLVAPTGDDINAMALTATHDGTVNVYTSNSTHAVIDIFGYFAPPLPAFQPFGVDSENLDQAKCNHQIGCPLIDTAARAGAQSLRLFAIWYYLEPQQNNFQWLELPWQIWYANSKGIDVHLTGTWAPQWANGATSTTAPFSGSCGDCGKAVLSASYTQSFFNNLALQFNGGDISGCAINYAPTCHPLVKYFGVWNEPNGMNNYDDRSSGNVGNYLNDFAGLYLIPAYNGVKAGNPAALVIAPELGTGGQYCGGFGGTCGWQSSWMSPISSFYSNYYDVISIHSHAESDNSRTAAVTASYVDFIRQNYDSGGKPIWVTERDFPVVSDLTQIYSAAQSRQAYWPKIFYNLGGYGQRCSTAQSLLCSDDGVTLQTTQFFTTYQNTLSPH